jgi:GR25 family glycosyltransferase involved in LPS biosynthesis
VTQLNIAIVAHKDRQVMAEKLAGEVNADHISLDNGGRGAGLNHRKAWEWLMNHPSDWGIVLEDDSVPCKDFRNQATAALEKAPARVVSLYLGRARPIGWQDSVEKAVERAQQKKACWITDKHSLHAVAMAADMRSLKMVWHALTLYSVYPPDEALSLYTYRNQIDVAYSYPSLVDHLDESSLIPGKIPCGRVAWKWGTRRKWTDEAVPLCAPSPW